MSADRFSFRLGRLLAMRERHEEQQAIALAMALERCDQLRREEAYLIERRNVARAGVLPEMGQDGSSGEALTMQQLVDIVDARIAALTGLLADAETDAANKRAALATAMTERRALERLRERQQDDWRADAARRERVAMDDVALRVVMDQREERTPA